MKIKNIITTIFNKWYSNFNKWCSNLNPSFVLALTVIFFLGVIGIYAGFFNKFSPTPTGFAEFGNYVGGIVGPVVAMFALFYLVTGIQVQKEELTKTYNLLIDQLNQQKYLDLMQTYRSILDTLEVFISPDKDVAGRGYVLRGKNSIKSTLREGQISESLGDIKFDNFICEINTKLIGLMKCNSSYIEKNDLLKEEFSFGLYCLLDQNETFDYETYMNFIYTIIKELSPQEKEVNRYFILFRNQLTQSELHLILLYTLLIGSSDDTTEKIMWDNKLFDNVIVPKNNNSTSRVSMARIPKDFFEKLMKEKYDSK